MLSGSTSVVHSAVVDDSVRNFRTTDSWMTQAEVPLSNSTRIGLVFTRAFLVVYVRSKNRMRRICGANLFVRGLAYRNVTNRRQ